MSYRALHIFMANTLSVKILLFWHTETYTVLNGNGKNHGIKLVKHNLNLEITNKYQYSTSILKIEDSNRLLIWLCTPRFMSWWFYYPLEFLFQVPIFLTLIQGMVHTVWTIGMKLIMKESYLWCSKSKLIFSAIGRENGIPDHTPIGNIYLCRIFPK